MVAGKVGSVSLCSPLTFLSLHHPRLSPVLTVATRGEWNDGRNDMTTSGETDRSGE